MDLKHVHGRVPWKQRCRMDIDMKHEHGHTAWTWTCSLDMDMQHGHGHAAWTWTCSMDLDIQHEHGHASRTWALGCSDFHFFSYFWEYLPFPLYLGTQVSENVKKLISLQPFCPNFFRLFRKSVFFPNFSKPIF